MKPEEFIESEDLPDSFHEIDEDDLAGEWRRQPQSFLQVMMKKAEAEKAKATAKARMEECYATLSTAIRGDPAKFRVTKVTESTVDEVVVTNQQYKVMQKAYIDAVYLCDLLDGAAKTLEHKKKALENLVYLLGQGIHAAPKVPNGSSAAKELRDQEMRQSAKKAQKHFKKKGDDSSD